MLKRRKFMASAWFVIGLALGAATVRDVSGIDASELMRSADLLGIALLAVSLVGACFYLGVAFWRSMPSARLLGLPLSILAALFFGACVLENLYQALTRTTALSVLAVMLSVAGVWFSVASFRLASERP